jgi:hypothetical protein
MGGGEAAQAARGLLLLLLLLLLPPLLLLLLLRLRWRRRWHRRWRQRLARFSLLHAPHLGLHHRGVLGPLKVPRRAPSLHARCLPSSCLRPQSPSPLRPTLACATRASSSHSKSHDAPTRRWRTGSTLVTIRRRLAGRSWLGPGGRGGSARGLGASACCGRAACAEAGGRCWPLKRGRQRQPLPPPAAPCAAALAVERQRAPALRVHPHRPPAAAALVVAAAAAAAAAAVVRPRLARVAEFGLGQRGQVVVAPPHRFVHGCCGGAPAARAPGAAGGGGPARPGVGVGACGRGGGGAGWGARGSAQWPQVRPRTRMHVAWLPAATAGGAPSLRGAPRSRGRGAARGLGAAAVRRQSLGAGRRGAPTAAWRG